MFGNQLQVLVKFGNSARMRSSSATHHRYEKTAIRQRVKFICDRRLRRVSRRDESWRSRIRNIEKEDLLLRTENAQQSATRQDLAVARESNVMWLIPSCPGSRERLCRDDFAVVRRPLVEVYDGQEIGIGPRLIASPYEEVFVSGVILAVFSSANLLITSKRSLSSRFT